MKNTLCDRPWSYMYEVIFVWQVLRQATECAMVTEREMFMTPADLFKTFSAMKAFSHISMLANHQIRHGAVSLVIKWVCGIRCYRILHRTFWLIKDIFSHFSMLANHQIRHGAVSLVIKWACGIWCYHIAHQRHLSLLYTCKSPNQTWVVSLVIACGVILLHSGVLMATFILCSDRHFGSRTHSRVIVRWHTEVVTCIRLQMLDVGLKCCGVQHSLSATRQCNEIFRQL